MNKTIKEQVSLIDISPTIAEIAGIKEKAFQGKSLLPVISGKEGDRIVISETIRNGLETTTNGKGFRLTACRTSDWKYILDEERGEDLFNLKYDPIEIKNLSKENPKKLKEFREKIIKHISYLKEESKYLSEKEKINLAISKLKNE